MTPDDLAIWNDLHERWRPLTMWRPPVPTWRFGTALAHLSGSQDMVDYNLFLDCATNPSPLNGTQFGGLLSADLIDVRGWPDENV